MVIQPNPVAGTVTVQCSVFSVQWSAQEPVPTHPEQQPRAVAERQADREQIMEGDVNVI